MAGVDTVVETSASPEQVREALLDFSPRRPERWPGISPEYYEVYEVGEERAVIREGTKLPGLGAFWARERYEWDDSSTIRWTVEESNFCAPGSFVSATLAPREGGGTRVALHWDRTGTTAMGKFMGFMVRRTKAKPVAGSFEKGLKKLEAR